MASSYRMLIAGVSMLSVTLALGIYVIIFGTLFSKVVPLFKSMTPPYWWSALNGDMIYWLMAFVWILIILCEIFIIVRLWTEASRTTTQDTDAGW